MKLESKTAESLAVEIVLVALLREFRDTPRVWENIERVTADSFANDHLSQDFQDRVQEILDALRDVAGPNPLRPALP